METERKTNDLNPSILSIVYPELTDASIEPMLFQCGHTSPPFIINAYGNEMGIQGNRYCGHCALKELQKISARCASCGKIILPGDITWFAKLTDRDVPPYAVLLKDDATFHPSTFMRCSRAPCMPNGGYAMGNWMEGRQFRNLDNVLKSTLTWEERSS
jgi:hypothetical protein